MKKRSRRFFKIMPLNHWGNDLELDRTSPGKTNLKTKTPADKTKKLFACPTMRKRPRRPLNCFQFSRKKNSVGNVVVANTRLVRSRLLHPPLRTACWEICTDKENNGTGKALRLRLRPRLRPRLRLRPCPRPRHKKNTKRSVAMEFTT